MDTACSTAYSSNGRGFLSASRARISSTQARGDEDKEPLDVPDAAELKALFEESGGLVKVPSVQVQIAETHIGINEGVGLIDRLSDADRLCSSRGSIGELSDLGEVPDQPGTGEYRGKAHHPKALTDEIASKGCDGSFEDVHRSTIVTQRPVAQALGEICGDLKGKSPRPSAIARARWPDSMAR